MNKINLVAARDNLGGAPLDGVLAADLRVVTMDFVEGAPTTHIMLAEHVDTFVEASKRLHFNPGINPHNGAETSRIWRLRVSHLMAQGPYWLSTPSLGSNGLPDGALIISEGISRTVWMDPDHKVLA